MDIELLKTFLEVNRTRHFARAAEHLYLTPSAVSARIRLLEEQLGVALFVRERNNLRLTPSGERLLGHAKLLLTSWERARQDVALGEAQLDQLTIAAVPGLWDSLLGGWLSKLRAAQPKLALRAESLNTDGVVQGIRRGQLDLGLLFEPPLVPELELRELSSLELVMVADRPGLSTEAAMENNYILVDWGSAFAGRHAHLYPESPSAATRVSTARLALDLLSQGGGAAYLARPMVRSALEERLIHPVEAAPSIVLPVLAIYANAGDKKEWIDAALELVREQP